MIKILIDANVFIFAFINPHGLPAQIIEAWLENKFTVVISIPLLQEIGRILNLPRLRLKYGFSDNEIAKYLQLIANHSEQVMPFGKLKVSRDPDDDLILETAIIAKVKYLISRDDDIKRDKKVIAKMESENITILSVSSFLNKLKEEVL